MHPLKKFLRNLRIAAADKDEYQAKLETLAGAAEIKVGTLYNLANPNQAKQLAPDRALRLELATNGQVPATSVCDRADSLIQLVDRIKAMRALNKQGE